MSKIQATEHALLTHSPQRVFDALMDLSAYSQWFPGEVRFSIQKQVKEGPGSQFRMGQGPIDWQVDVQEVEAPSRIHMRYYDGPWDGTATWELAATPEGGTRLTYSVDLKLKGMMIMMLSKMVDTQKFHAEQMHKVANHLQQWLDKTA
ncbi:MAG: SRPBCC family protein [Bacteroidetes bacterium]|nr:SRPBCC family protein [Bacteroidota bacterium]